MPENTRTLELITKWEAQSPAVWSLCYPKHYNVSGNFGSPKHLALNLIEYLAPGRTDSNNMGQKEWMGYFAAAGLIRFKVPIFFVAPDLFMAVQKSTPPAKLDWVNMRLPFDSAAFALPRGRLVHEELGEVNYLWYTRLRKGAPKPSLPGYDSVGIVEDDCLMIFAPCMSAPEYKVLGRLSFGSHTPVLDLRDADSWKVEDPFAAEESELVADDLTLLAVASTLLCNLLLVMDARKDLVSRGAWNGKRTSKGLEFWTPNMLGKDYVLHKPSSVGNGPTPRMHWRRGHVRQQPYGEGHALRRPVWIEPTLIAAG